MMIVSMIDEKDTQYGWSVQPDQEQEVKVKEEKEVKEVKEKMEQASGITSAVTVEDNDFEL